MEDKSVLDDWREEGVPTTDQYRRSLRFLFYNLGIAILVGARIGLMVIQFRNDPSMGYVGLDGIPDLVTIGVAGLWLFSGLGLVAIFRARQERATDLIFALVLVFHLVVFIITSGVLYRFFSTATLNL
ncbi:MAG: hypothetical protein AAFY48_20120 [Bacteroidota bacterium]